MSIRHPRNALCAALLLALACGPASEGPESAEADAEITPIAGMYEVSGATVEQATGEKREISGSVILAEDGDRYNATFHLATTFEGDAGVLPAEVIGRGFGSVEGRTLRGKAETQLVISSVPGIDPGFAFIPRTTTTRLLSRSVTTIAGDGTVDITIENSGAEGEDYAPTRTTLSGVRIAARPIDDDEDPGVAAEPPTLDE